MLILTLVKKKLKKTGIFSLFLPALLSPSCIHQKMGHSHNSALVDIVHPLFYFHVINYVRLNVISFIMQRTLCHFVHTLILTNVELLHQNT